MVVALLLTKTLKIERHKYDIKMNDRTVSIGRTFWEKITILHREANRPENKKMPKRYATQCDYWAND